MPASSPGREHRVELRYNAAGQPVELRESGFSPIDAEGRPNPVPIERRLTWRYATINGRSVLAELDGPLPDGPDASPRDRDLVRLHWDERGSFIRALEGPGGRRSEIDSDPTTGLPLRVRDGDAHETRLRHDAAGQLIEWRSGAPGEAPERIHVAAYDALGHLVALRSGEDEESLRPRWLRAFDAAGRLQWHADALGILHTWAYDHREPRHRDRDAQRQPALRRRRRYDEHGRLVDIGDDKGFTRSLHHDAVGRLVGISGQPRTRSVTGRAPDGRRRHGSTRHRPRAPAHGFTTTSDEQSSNAAPTPGTRWRSFDAAGRLVAMGDPLGHRARYTWDLRGRILAQEITDGRSGTTETTRWRYDGPRLMEVDHPNGRERHEYDPRGWRSARIVSLKREGGELTVITRYEHDAAGHLIATHLPDGSHLRYERNGQGQVVAAEAPAGGHALAARAGPRADDRQRVRARPLRAARLPDRQRRAYGARAHPRRHPGPRRSSACRRARRPVRNARALLPIEPGQPLATRVERIFGISAPRRGGGPEANAAELAEAAPRGAIEGAKPPPQEIAAPAGIPLLDYRYLWDPEGNLLHERRHEPDGPQPSTRRSQAYDLRNQLVASVEWQDDGEALAETDVWRYAYDRHQRRVLAQQGARSQQESIGHTRRPLFSSGTHRVLPSSLHPANGRRQASPRAKRARRSAPTVTTPAASPGASARAACTGTRSVA